MTVDHAATLEAFADAWADLDIDRILDFFTDDAVYHNIPMEPLEGRAAIREFLEGFVSMASSITFETHRQLIDGDLVMNERTDTLVMGGNPVALPVCGVFEFSGAKIARWRDYFDMGQFTGS